MKILIASGIYPPDIGGPAQYARNLFETWRREGNDVKVAAYRWERAFPPLIRHILYFTKVIRKGWGADLILVLDTWSAAVPTMLACKLMGKKYILRTGGDFLWEDFVERTGEPVLFREFYEKKRDFTFKEKLVFKWGGASLRNAACVIFSTKWQRDIFVPVYKIDPTKTEIVANFCGAREEFMEPENRSFVGGTRVLRWKNIDLLKSAFAKAEEMVKAKGLADVELDLGRAVYSSFVEKIRRSYAVILVSIGDISPNMILDAIRAGTPFIVTKETGIADLIRPCAIFVDPLDEKDISEKIVWLADPKNRAEQAKKVQQFSFAHTWEDIAKEIAMVNEKHKRRK